VTPCGFKDSASYREAEGQHREEKGGERVIAAHERTVIHREEGRIPPRVQLSTVEIYILLL